MKSPAIPTLDGVPVNVAKVLGPVRETLEILKGRRGSIPKKLGPTATDAERNNKINELIDWLTQ